MKICFVAPKAYPLFNPDIKAIFGGAEVDIFLLAVELAKDEHFEVSCITADYGQPPVEFVQNVKVIKSLNFNSTIFTQTEKLWKALHVADPQIIFQKTASPGTFLLALYAKLKNKIFIYRTAHDDDCNGVYLKQNPLKGRLFKWGLRHAHYVFAQNDSHAQELKKTIHVSSEVIRNAHYMPNLHQAEKQTILWVARSAAFKQPEIFLDLACEYPGEHFTMVCPRATGDDDYDRLRRKVAEIKNCTFIEYVPFHEMDKVFQTAKVFVNTSDSEGFPNTFIQAAKHAVPILSLNVNPDHFLDRSHCGRCADGKWEDFVRYLKYFLEPENNRKYGMNGRRYAEEHHDVRKTVEHYKKIFSVLIHP